MKSAQHCAHMPYDVSCTLRIVPLTHCAPRADCDCAVDLALLRYLSPLPRRGAAHVSCTTRWPISKELHKITLIRGLLLLSHSLDYGLQDFLQPIHTRTSRGQSFETVSGLTRFEYYEKASVFILIKRVATL